MEDRRKDSIIMTAPMDPLNPPDGETEFSWGAGIFPPGIADNEGQKNHQDDFSDNLKPTTQKIGGVDDNYARAVADRRTDPTDRDSGRDFGAQGNPDRYGGEPPLIRSDTQPNRKTFEDEPYWPPLKRKP